MKVCQLINKNTKMVERHLSPSEVVQRLGYKIHWFYSHAAQFRPYGLRKIKGDYRLPESGLERWLNDNDELRPAGEESAHRVAAAERARLSAA